MEHLVVILFLEKKRDFRKSSFPHKLAMNNPLWTFGRTFRKVLCHRKMSWFESSGRCLLNIIRRHNPALLKHY